MTYFYHSAVSLFILYPDFIEQPWKNCTNKRCPGYRFLSAKRSIRVENHTNRYIFPEYLQNRFFPTNR